MSTHAHALSPSRLAFALAATLIAAAVPRANGDSSTPLLLSRDGFRAEYREDALALTPVLHPQYLPLDLTTISNAGAVCARFRLDTNACAALERNGFVVLAADQDGPVIEVLEELLQCGVPLFITSDLMLHLYHLVFDAVLQSIESAEFHPELVELATRLCDASESQYDTFTGDLKEAARRNVAYSCVALRLLGEDVQPPGYVASVVTQELAKVEAHAGFGPSPIFGYAEDYSQYVPRGHYTRSKTLEKYFKAMMWFGRMTFLLKEGLVTPQQARIQTLQAMLVATTLNRPELADSWNRIYAVTSFFVGESDDLMPSEYAAAWLEVAQDPTNLLELASGDTLLSLRHRLAALKPPRIYGGTGNAVMPPSADEADLYRLLDTTIGLRLMGQRFIPDSYMFQQLIFPAAGDYVGTNAPFTCVATAGGPFRCFPRGLDVMGVLGSRRAVSILDREGDTEYEGYAEQFNALRREFRAYGPADWNRNLYGGWLYVLKSLFRGRGVRYPCFMRGTAWRDRQLQSALGSWTELRHDTILYAKQSNSGSTTSQPPPPPERDRGHAEPVPHFHNRLLALTRMMRQGFQDLQVGGERARSSLQALETTLSRLAHIATRELEDIPLSDDDYHFLEWGFIPVLQATMDLGVESVLDPTSLIADVHTDPNSQSVLEEALAGFNLMLVAYRLPGGRMVLGAGPVYSYYEFKWPMANRLTNEAWRDMLSTGTRPARPPWTRTFRQPVELGPENASTGDRDGDGITDGDECAAGTDPDDPASCLRVTRVKLAGDAPVVHWQSAPGKRYRCEYSDDLRTWNLMGTPVQATSERAASMDTSAENAPRRYYRVKTIP